MAVPSETVSVGETLTNEKPLRAISACRVLNVASPSYCEMKFISRSTARAGKILIAAAQHVHLGPLNVDLEHVDDAIADQLVQRHRTDFDVSRWHPPPIDRACISARGGWSEELWS